MQKGPAGHVHHFGARQLLQRLLFAGLNAGETHGSLRSPQSARARRHLFTLPKCGPAVYAFRQESA